MIHAARALDLKVMLGCMNESSLGIAEAAAIAPLVDVVDLDGHLLNANDAFTGLGLERRPGRPRQRPRARRHPARAVAVKRYVMLCEGGFDEDAKTATGVMRYADAETVAVVDSRSAGSTAADHVPGLASDVPVVASLADALPLRPTVMLIGIAPAGGKLPPAFRAAVLEAMAAGLDVESGLHDLLGDDPELAAAASAAGVELRDLRRAPAGLDVPTGANLDVLAHTVLAVGSDCALGKMTVCLELDREARRRGIGSQFVATGQTGIAIAGWGIAVDEVVSDFVAGAAEQLVLEGHRRAGDRAILWIEGQGSINHPYYSAVTLGLLHGSAPHTMIFVHEPGRRLIEGDERYPIPPVPELIDEYQRMAAHVRPAPVVAVAAKTNRLSDARRTARDRRAAHRHRAAGRRPGPLRRWHTAGRRPGSTVPLGSAVVPDPRLSTLAHVLCNYSLQVEKDDLVLIQGPALARPLLVEVVKTVTELGAHPMLRPHLESVEAVVLEHSNRAQLETVTRLDELEVELPTKLMSIWANGNTRYLSSAPPENLTIRSAAHRELFQRGLKRVAEGEAKWVGTCYPARAGAQEAGMSLSDWEDFVYTAGHLEDADPIAFWRSQSARQQAIIERLSTVHELRIVAEDTDLTLEVGGRIWLNADGRENFPDGEIYTSPVETATRGHIAFSFDATYLGRDIAGVRLWFEDGRVVREEAARGQEYLHRLLDQDEGARYLGEVAFGLNDEIQAATRDTLFDEKIGGTCHVALGMAFPEAGGQNTSGLHWDIVRDLRAGGEVYGDGELLARDGAFL